ncbi:glycosyltransferase family 2 protein [Halarcobacter sp.]|uniref:glycosyltransferase family 2 protein n=1 Tax=Halarcobacter sp. TaxID=2321133 RepID=UPI0029F4B072|nr:glycosyltransferase family 2 protein [Halarcobacter sp.]
MSSCKNPLVSIIVPIFNAENYINKCLNSILNQTMKNIEIIIVDDASTDRSLFIVENYKNKDSRIKIIGLKYNKGPGNARNKGIIYASSKFVMFIDSDDYIHPKMVEILYNEALSKNCDIVSCRYHRVSNDEVLSTSPLDIYSNDSICDFMKGCISPMVWNKIYSIRLFIDNDIFFPEELYFEDQIVTFQLFFYAKNISVLENIFYNWNVTDKSITNSISLKHINDLFRVFKLIKKFLIDKKVYKHYEDYFLSKLLYITTTHLLSLLFNQKLKNQIFLENIENKLYSFNNNILEIVKTNNKSYYINYIYNLFKITKNNNLKLRYNQIQIKRNIMIDSYNLDSDILFNLIKLKSIKELIIYGTGEIAHELIKKIKNKKIKIIMILDSNNTASTFDYNNVYTLESSPINIDNKYIIIASIAYANEIIQKIKNYSLTKKISPNIISINDFIDYIEIK